MNKGQPTWNQTEGSEKQVMGLAVTSASRDIKLVKGVSGLNEGKGPGFWLMGSLKPVPRPCNESGVGC